MHYEWLKASIRRGLSPGFESLFLNVLFLAAGKIC